MTYTETVRIERETFNRVNRLLAIENMENMTDEEMDAAGAETDTSYGIYYVEFQNGAAMVYILCSGQSNYYDDVMWLAPDGEHIVSFDCNYDLSDIEVDLYGDTYCVKIELV